MSFNAPIYHVTFDNHNVFITTHKYIKILKSCSFTNIKPLLQVKSFLENSTRKVLLLAIYNCHAPNKIKHIIGLHVSLKILHN